MSSRHSQSKTRHFYLALNWFLWQNRVPEMSPVNQDGYSSTSAPMLSPSHFNHKNILSGQSQFPFKNIERQRLYHTPHESRVQFTRLDRWTTRYFPLKLMRPMYCKHVRRAVSSSLILGHLDDTLDFSNRFRPKHKVLHTTTEGIIFLCSRWIAFDSPYFLFILCPSMQEDCS